ncbi:MAG: aromatic amino acid transaminase [Candidatus Rhabdochlamydia sp.]
MKHSFFNQTPLAPEDPIFKLQAAFQQDPRNHKIDLSIGLYRNEQLETPVLASVKLAEKALFEQETTKTYLPIQGNFSYLQETGKLIFGDLLWQTAASRISMLQVVGGTCGLHIGAEVLKNNGINAVAILLPTWPNHLSIFKQSSYTIYPLRYYDPYSHKIDFFLLLERIKNLCPKTALLLHGCCHNPTGMDFSYEEWNLLLPVIKERALFVIVDLAYQGLGEGLDPDAYLIRSLAQEDVEFMVVASYSKNFGLYSERVGSLFVMARDAARANRLLSQLKVCARTLYSNPPRHGASLVEKILLTPHLKTLWQEELTQMRLRIVQMRYALHEALLQENIPRDFSHLLNGKGMFSLLGLTPDEVHRLQIEEGIYMTFDGRINLAGLNSKVTWQIVKPLRRLWQSNMDISFS